MSEQDNADIFREWMEKRDKAMKERGASSDAGPWGAEYDHLPWMTRVQMDRDTQWAVRKAEDYRARNKEAKSTGDIAYEAFGYVCLIIAGVGTLACIIALLLS